MNIDSKMTFSTGMEILREQVFTRLKPNRIREGTHTGPDNDGKTPFLDVFESSPEAPYALNLADAIVRSWMESPIVIEPDELLVGVPRPSRPLCEHFSWGIQLHEEVFEHSAYCERKDELVHRIQFVSSKMFPLGIEHIRSECIQMFGSEKVADAMNGRLWWVGGYQGHTVPNYPKLLCLGVDGLLNEVKACRSQTDNLEKTLICNALVNLLEGFSAWIVKYADRAHALSKKDAANANRYLAIAKNCYAVARGRPETFYEAAQLVWFFALWDWVDCIGRADQYLYPFYQKQSAGNPFPAEDVMVAFFLKGLEHGFHNITLGGVRPGDGSDATNELTYLMLQISRVLHETHPRLSVRIHRESPEWLMRLITKMWSEGMSDPTIVSDVNVVEALVQYGVLIEDARDYTVLGCQEIEIPGKSNFGCEDGLINLAKIFECTINDGRCRITGEQFGLQTGFLTDYGSIDALWAAYLAQMRFFTERFIKLCNRGVEIRSANLAKLVKMPLTDDCVKLGMNPDAGGAIYNFGVVETAGVSAVADSFAAIQRVVFEEKLMTMEILARAIEANFDGFERERQLLLNRAPKFGNDDPMSDEYARRVLDSFWSEIGQYKSVRGDVFMGACSLLDAGVRYGEQTWAMPDGRFTGEPLGNSIGPRTGADHSGLTALLKSVMKLPLAKGAGGTTLNVLLPKSLLRNETLREDIGALMMVYMMNGGQMAQITTASHEDMLDAQQHPERHGNLIVRIGGFSIRFIELKRQMQDEIIARYSSS